MPNRLFFIGITGGVGAGKTTVLEYIREHYNAKILSGDEIARELQTPGNPVYDAIKETFPDESLYQPDGSMDRAAFARVVFSDEDKRNRLNELVHPAVKRYIIEEFEREQKRAEKDFLILEAALLIEGHYDELCDELWYVYASEATRAKRLTESRGYSQEKIERIFASQLPEAVYRHHCAAVIDNDGDRESMIFSLKGAFERIGE